MDLTDGAGNDLGLLHFKVGRFGFVYDGITGGFTGDTVALVAFTLFCLAVAAIMFRAWRGAKGAAFYAYGTIHAAGFSLFALLTGLAMLEVTLRHLLRPHDFSMMYAYSAISGASWRFMMVTALPVLAFAVAMAVSNVALVRHEGFHPKNVLGVGIGVALVAGEALAFFLYGRDLSGSEREIRLWNTLCNVYATAFACFECVLAGAIVCGLKAARHVPAPDADYILILGCKFRRDGTLTPLLRGRVDRAIEFWKRQRETTGREAVLVPSGGQGADEPIAEAEAMRRYLLAQGIPEDSIAAGGPLPQHLPEHGILQGADRAGVARREGGLRHHQLPRVPQRRVGQPGGPARRGRGQPHQVVVLAQRLHAGVRGADAEPHPPGADAAGRDDGVLRGAVHRAGVNGFEL